MRLGISTACFYPQLIEQTVAQLAQFGVHAIECFINTESEFTLPFAETLSTAAKAGGLEIVSVHPYSSFMEGIMLFSDYARRTQDGMVQYERYFAFCQKLGAHLLTFHGERDMGQQEDARRWARRVEVYHRLCERAAAYGVTIAQENVAWCKSADPAFLRRLADEVPSLRYTLDLKQAHRAGQDWRRCLDAMGERLANVHINDFDATHSCLLPGDGEMAYEELFRRLHAIRYHGTVMIEVYRSNFTEDRQMAQAVRQLGHWVSL